MFVYTQTKMVATLLLAILLASPLTAGILSPKMVKHVQGRDDYDRYLLATSWAGTTCQFHDCTHYGADEIFNLHGLWPSTSGDSPQDCSDVNFNEQNLSPYLKQNLYTYWNSFYHDNWEFLDHEITKHGSCWRPDYGNLSDMNKELADIIQTYDASDDYSKINTFLTLTLAASKLVNPYKALWAKNIRPSDSQTYDIDEILAVFNEDRGVKNTVLPVCLAEKSTGNLFIAELRFCIDLDFKPIACNMGELQRQLKRCRTGSLSYPPFPR